MYDQMHKLFYLHENQYITSTDYLQTVVLIEAGSMETYHLNLNYNINQRMLQNETYGITDQLKLHCDYSLMLIQYLRMYATRRIRDAFRENRDISDPDVIKSLMKKGQDSLEMMKRQVPRHFVVFVISLGGSVAEGLEHWTCNFEALRSSPTLTPRWISSQ